MLALCTCNRRAATNVKATSLYPSQAKSQFSFTSATVLNIFKTTAHWTSSS